MRRHTSTIVFALCLSALVSAAAVGCSSSETPGGGPSGTGMMSSGAGGSGNNSGGGMMGNGGSGGSYSSVGERIYLTGMGADGQQIPHSGTRVSQGSLMMGSGGCGSCHGADGRGGTIRMTGGTSVKTPDITYDALIEKASRTKPSAGPSVTDSTRPAIHWTKSCLAGR